MTKTTSPFPSDYMRSALPGQHLAAPSYNQAVIAVAAFGRHVVNEPGLLENIVVNIGTSGTVTDTILRFQRIPAGSSAAANIGDADVTIDDAVADGHVRIVPINLEVNVGDVIICNVTQAPTGGANLAWSPNIKRQFAKNP